MLNVGLSSHSNSHHNPQQVNRKLRIRLISQRLFYIYLQNNALAQKVIRLYEILKLNENNRINSAQIFFERFYLFLFAVLSNQNQYISVYSALHSIQKVRNATYISNSNSELSEEFLFIHPQSLLNYEVVKHWFFNESPMSWFVVTTLQMDLPKPWLQRQKL